MEFLLVTAKIIILLSGIMFTGIIVERNILHKYEANLYVSFIIGVSIIYSLALLGLKLQSIVIFIYAINFIGFYKYRKNIFKINIDKYLLFISLPIMIAISFQMVWYWDSVVNWFFHAKIIAYASKFSMANILPADQISIYESLPDLLQSNPMISGIYGSPASHWGYPKMLPVLSALVSEITSVHNEALPKSSMLYLLFGVLLGFSEVKYFSRKEKRFMFIILFSLMGIHSFSGYLDGWLSIYVALCCLFMINFKKGMHERDIINCICTLCFLPMFKNEGLVLALVLLLILALGNINILISIDKLIYKIEIIILVLLPTIIWTYFKYKLNMASAGSLVSGEIMIERLYYRIVYEIDNFIYYFFIFSNLIYPLIFVLFVLYLLKSNRIIISNYVWIPVKISIVYISILIIIFMITNINLNNLFEFTTRRATMPIMMMLYIFGFMVIKELKIFDNMSKNLR